VKELCQQPPAGLVVVGQLFSEALYNVQAAFPEKHANENALGHHIDKVIEAEGFYGVEFIRRDDWVEDTQ